MGRPKKYATAAERQAAYRRQSDTSVVDIRMKNETIETLNKFAEEMDISRNEVVHQLIQFALANRAWLTAPRFTSYLPRRENPDA